MPDYRSSNPGPSRLSTPPPWLFASLLLGLIGCTGGPPSDAATAGVTRADSGGVEIVTTSGIETLTRWRLEPEPILTLGTVDGSGPDAFNFLSGALWRPDGTILVTELAPAAAKVFDHRGTFLRQVVRDGLGPNELRFASAPVRLRGDSIAILDDPMIRAVVLTPDLTAATTIQLTPYRFSGGYAIPLRLISPRETIARLYTVPTDRDRAGPVRPPLVIGRVPIDGSGFDSIATGRGSELFMTEGGRGLDIPMARRTVFAVTPELLYLGDSEDAIIGVWRVSGPKIRTIRWIAAPDSTSSADAEASFRHDSADLMTSREMMRARPELLRSMFARMRAVKAQPVTPYFTRLIPTDDGGLWIERRTRPWNTTTSFLVADSTGAITASLEAPAEFTPLQVGSDWVLGRWRTPEDVLVVRQFRIHGRRPARKRRTPAVGWRSGGNLLSAPPRT